MQVVLLVTAAGAAAAGGATGALGYQGFLGVDREALLPAVVHEVYRDLAAAGGQVLVDKVGQTVNLVLVVVFLWFIQNQAQAGAASAAALQENPQGLVQILFLHKALNGFAGRGGNFDHDVSFPYWERPRVHLYAIEYGN